MPVHFSLKKRQTTLRLLLLLLRRRRRLLLLGTGSCAFCTDGLNHRKDPIVYHEPVRCYFEFEGGSKVDAVSQQPLKLNPE